MTNVPLHELPWTPLSVAEVADRFAGFPGPWWIAGGWAIDLFVGKQTREHADIDVLILRDDQRHLFDTLSDWEIHAAVMHKVLRLWPTGRPFPPEVHDIWCRPDAKSAWRLQIMLLDTDGERWVFRRDHRIGSPLHSLGSQRKGISFVAPEIQLLYKSKNRLPKDEADLAAALPAMSANQIAWLRYALQVHDSDNPWITVLDHTITKLDE